jgi:hypothetical protein
VEIPLQNEHKAHSEQIANHTRNRATFRSKSCVSDDNCSASKVIAFIEAAELVVLPKISLMALAACLHSEAAFGWHGRYRALQKHSAQHP